MYDIVSIPLWVVVVVESGIPSTTEIFKNKKDAQKFEEQIRNSLNLEDDETGIFENFLGVEPTMNLRGSVHEL